MENSKDYDNDVDIDISLCLSSNESPTSDYFDRVIGHIEDIAMEDEFQALRKDFLEKNWTTFENTEENKIEYMEIFENYVNIFETFIVNELNKRMNDFDMDAFAKCLEEQKSYVDNEIFDIIQSLLDFLVFKEMMLDYRSEKEGKYDNLKTGLIVTRMLDNDGNDVEGK